MSTSNSQAAPRVYAPVPINIISEFGVTLYSQWRSRRTGALLIVIQRQCEGAGVDMCTNLVILDVAKEVATDVKPEQWIGWIKDRAIHKQYKER